MVKKNILILVFLCFYKLGITQNNFSCSKKAGVFKTASEFISNAFTDSICMDSKKGKIKPGNNSLLKMQSKSGVTKKYLPGEIYGYSDSENKFRFFSDDKSEAGPYGYFKMEGNSGLIIYSQWNLHGGTFYFYSKDFDSPIKELLKKNLDRDFPNEDFSKEIRIIKNMNKSKESALAIIGLFKKYYPPKK